MDQGERPMTATARIVCLFVTSAVCAMAADPALLNLARPDVNFVMGIDVSQLASSPQVAMALAEARRSKPEVEQLFDMLGPDPFSNLAEIVVSGRTDPGQPNSEPKNLLVAARGSFGGDTFMNLVCANCCEPQEYREREILRFQSKDTGEPGYVTFLDSSYAALGKLEDVRGAIDRSAMETESVFSPALQNAVQSLGHHHIWLAANGPFGNSMGGGMSAGGMMPPGAAQKVNGFGLGITLGRNIDLAIELESHSPQDAKQLYDMVNGLMALMKAGDTDADTKALLDSLQLTQRGSSLSASLQIPEALIEKQLAQSSTLAQAGTSAAPTASRPSVALAGPSTPRVATVAPRRPRREGGIRIYGLKNEPVEVPTHPK